MNVTESVLRLLEVKRCKCVDYFVKKQIVNYYSDYNRKRNPGLFGQLWDRLFCGFVLQNSIVRCRCRNK